MTNLDQLAAESTAIGKTLELISNVIDQLKENLKLKFKKGEPWVEVSKDSIGYYFYDANCFIGYSFDFLNDTTNKDFVISFDINKSLVSKDKLKKIPSNTYYFYEEWYYFKINSHWLENSKKGKELYQYCEKVMKDVVKKIS
jgi:hypothetical protein